MKKLMFALSLLILFASVACSSSSSEKSGEQKDSLDTAFKAKIDSIMFLIRAVAEENNPKPTDDKDTIRRHTCLIGDPPITLVFINGERCCDFAGDHEKIFNIKEFSIKKLKAFLKKRNFIFDDVKILKDDESLEKYRKGRFLPSGANEKRIEAVYEIKAHPINQKGEIFEVTAQMPYFPGGDKALMAFIEKNIHRPEKMLRDSVHGKVVVECIIEKDGSIEEYGIAKNLLKDKSGNPCTDSAIKKLCEKEALRIFKMMPRWEPARKESGEAVRLRYYIPFTF